MYVFTYPFFVKIIKPDGRHRDSRTIYAARAPDLNLLVIHKGISLDGIYSKAEESLYWLLRDRIKYKDYIPPQNVNLCASYLRSMDKGKPDWLYIMVRTVIDPENEARPDIHFISRRLNIIRIKAFGRIKSGIYND